MNRPAPRVIASAPKLLLDYLPASFWQRYVAWSLDWLILSPLLLLLVLPALSQAWSGSAAWMAGVQDWLLDRILRGQDTTSPLELMRALMADPVQHQAASEQVAHITSAITKALVFTGLIAGIYFIGFEASAWRATPGKRWLGLEVQDLNGQPPGLARAALRFFSGIFSWVTLNLGHVMVAFRSDGRALHDLLAGTRVSALAPMPTWARSFLWAQILALGLVVFVLVVRLFWMLGQIATM
jgi:hypothetical protein